MAGYFEFWNLPESNDKTTRIIRADKEGKYLTFYRDDGKICKYDLSTGNVYGFSGKKVKSLQSQFKDLTMERFFNIFEDEKYRNFLKYVWRMRRRNKAYRFVEILPEYSKYEQFFSAGIKDLGYKFPVSFNDVPNGLIKICRECELCLDKALWKLYNEDVDLLNHFLEIKLSNISYSDLLNAILFKKRSNQRHTVNENDLTEFTMPEFHLPHATVPIKLKSYFFLLINKYGYNNKLLMEYYDNLAKDRRYKTVEIYRYIYDYTNMMNELYDDYDRYPNDLLNAHIRAVNEYNNLNIIYDEAAFIKRNVLDYECEIDGFRFIYPKSTDDIKNEGINQHNCVASYIHEVLNEDCHIMFMRPINNLEDSYITLEIRSNRIVQAKRKNNALPSIEEKQIIEKWNQKYKNYNKIF